jgi:outer membrane receptor for ferrienterochelin and colicins
MKRVLSVIATLFSLAASAQNTIAVHVKSEENGEGVELAYVNIYSLHPRQLKYTAITDENGNALVNIYDYPSELQISSTGYDPLSYSVKDSSTNSLVLSIIKRHTSLDEVVVTGVPTPTKPQNALSLYKVVTAASIRAQGGVTLNEVLGNQLNINISNDAVLGSGIRMQGLGGDKVKTLIDGVALNGREGGNIDMGQINLFNVDRIEIVQGPMSVIYGSDALGGVINVIEKANRKPWEVQATAHYESVGKYNVNMGAARNWKKHTFALGGGRNYFQGWKYLESATTYNNVDTVYIPRKQLFKPKEQYLGNFSYQYLATSGFKLKFSSNLLQEKVTNRGRVAPYTPFEAGAIDEYYYTNRSLNRLALEGKLGGKGSWQMLNGYAHYKRIRKTVVKDLVALTESLVEDEDVQDTSTFNDLTSRGMYSNNLSRIEFTIGYDISSQTAESQKIAEGTHKLSDYAVFGLSTVPIFSEKLKIQVGIRAAHNSVFAAPIVPAVHLLLNASPSIQVRGSYAKGFRAPSLKELYLTFNDNNHNLLGNPALKAEKGDHLQLSASYQVFQREANYMQVLVTGFYNNVLNGIVLIPLRPEDSTSIDYSYANIVKQENTIATTQVEGQQGNLHYMLGYSFHHTFGQPGIYGSFNAQEVNSSISYYSRLAKLTASVFYKYIGEQPFLRAGIDGSATYDGNQPDYHMMDASLERSFWKKRIQLTLGVKNILNVQTLTATGLTTGGIHSGNGSINFLPRSLFTTLRFTLD